MLEALIKQPIPMHPTKIITLGAMFIACASRVNAFESSPPLAEEMFLKRNLVVINTPAGSGTGSIIGKEGNRYYVLTSGHVIAGIAKAEEVDILTGDGETTSAAVLAKASKVDLAIVSFVSQKCFPEAYIGAESAMWMKRISPQAQPNRMIIAGLSAVDPAISKKPIIRSAVAALAVKIDASDAVDGYQYGYDAPTSRGMSGGALLTDSFSITGGRTCRGNCNQPYGYHLAVHGRGERDSLRGSAKTGYNFAVPSIYAIPLMANSGKLQALNTTRLYVSVNALTESSMDLDTAGFKEDGGFILDAQSCKPDGLHPVIFKSNKATDAILMDFRK